jgi:serine/threonine protein phosphatase PrpC
MNQPQTITCPNCQTLNRSKAKICRQCHTPLVAPAQETAHLPLVASSPATAQQPDDPKTPPIERTTRRLDDLTDLAPMPEGAIIGRYEVRQLLSTEPSINSYLVTDEQNQQRAMFEAANVDQWTREKRLSERQLVHSAIVAPVEVFEQVQYDNQPRAYLVAEYPLTPLAQLGTANELDAVSWGVQLAGGLAFLHDNDLALGSIQPANFVMTSDNQVKWWNLDCTQPLTPELQALDVWRLAKTLYQLTTTPGQVAAVWSPTAAQVFARAFASDPRQRYQDAPSFAEDLQKAINALGHPKSTTFTVGRLTDTGRARELNEDTLITIDTLVSIQQRKLAVGLYVVADGMGGAESGEVASRMVGQAIARHMQSNVFDQLFADIPPNVDYGATLKAAVEHANAEVFRARDAARTDMGSTVVAALVIGNQAYIVNVGDSRAYLIAPDRIEKISRDHSLVQTMVDRREIGEDDVYTHPQRSILMRSVGDKPLVQVDLFTQTFEPGQYLLLCSDGLWEMVHPKSRLQEIVGGAPNVQQACRELIKAANQNGGHDNISLVLVKFESE